MSELRSLNSFPEHRTLPPSPDTTAPTLDDWQLPAVSVSGIDSPASFLLLDLADQAGVSVLIPPELTSSPVTVDLRRVPAQTAFRSIAEQVGGRAMFDGTTVLITKGDQGAERFTVFRIGHSDPSQVTEAVRAVVGGQATVSTFGDRIVVAGTDRAVRQADQLAAQFETGPDGWRLEVRVVALSETLRRALGLDWDLGAGLNLSAGVSSGDLVAPVLTGTSASVVVRVLAEASDEGTEAAVLNSATLYVLEGSTATLNQGERVPIPRFQTSPEGTTTIVGYDYIDTGFTLEATARRVPGGVRLGLRPVVSSITGFVQQAPITTQSRVDVETVISDGSWLVVSGLTSTAVNRTTTSIPGGRPPIFGKRTDSVTDSTLVVLVRADRVYSSAHSPSP